MTTSKITRWTLLLASCATLFLASCKDNDDAYERPSISVTQLTKDSNGNTLISKDEKYETAFYPELLVHRVLLKEGHTDIKPHELTIATLNKKYAGTLVSLKDVQFLASELGQTYADPQGKDKNRNVNRTLVDRSGAQLIVRTSSYAKFAGRTVPSGSGTITAILTYFRDTPQLLILREQDVQLTGARF